MNLGTQAAQIDSTSHPTHNPFKERTSPPINILPLEVLGYIFSLVCNVRLHSCPAEVKIRHRYDDSRPFLKEPVILSHVCSHWRQVAVNLPLLWSHIDLYPDQLQQPKFSPRPKIYAARSVHALLDIHIILPHGSSEYLILAMGFMVAAAISEPPIIFPFLTSMAPRMRSLSIVSATGPVGSCECILATCLGSCAPGTLTKVSIEAGSLPGSRPPVMRDNIRLVGCDFEEASVEAAWLSVKTLRFTLCRVEWTSKAYHGLSELRLRQCGAPRPSELAHIFQFSPQLRVFELDEIEASSAESPPLTPIRLDYLETLALSSVEDEHLGSVLGLIAPGSKPLSLSILNPYRRDSGFRSRHELQSFISRSKVTRLCANEFTNYSQLSEVLGLMPSVQTLAVHRFNCDTIDEGGVLTPSPILNTLYVIRSTRTSPFTWPSIEKFVEKHRVKKLVLWKYDPRYSGVNDSGKMSDNLLTICPAVTVVPDEGPNPIEDWY